MNNNHKTLFLLFSIFINFYSISYANETVINAVDINANIKDNGNIDITEIWKGEFYTGTELYHFYEDLILADISNFCVLENGVKYDYIENWNITDSKDKKEFKDSINQNEDGIELVWGIGNPGYHEYKIIYTLNSFFQNDELKLEIFNYNNPYPNKVGLTVKGNFQENSFAKIIPENENFIFNNKEIQYKIDNLNSNIKIYLNQNGIDNSIEKQNIIRIKSNDKTNFFTILKKGIILLSFMSGFILIFIFHLNKEKVKYEFKPF